MNATNDNGTPSGYDAIVGNIDITLGMCTALAKARLEGVTQEEHTHFVRLLEKLNICLEQYERYVNNQLRARGIDPETLKEEEPKGDD